MCTSRWTVIYKGKNNVCVCVCLHSFMSLLLLFVVFGCTYTLSMNPMHCFINENPAMSREAGVDE